MKDFNHPISLVGVGCTTRFHSPRTARLQSGKITMRKSLVQRNASRVGTIAPRAVTHETPKRPYCTSPETGRKEIRLHPASLRRSLSYRSNPRQQGSSPVASIPAKRTEPDVEGTIESGPQFGRARWIPRLITNIPTTAKARSRWMISTGTRGATQ